MTRFSANHFYPLLCSETKNDVLGEGDAHFGWFDYNALIYISFLISYANLNDFVVRWLSLVELKCRHHAIYQPFYKAML